MGKLLVLLGPIGVVFLISLGVFFLVLKNSEKIFAWIDNQTFGTRDYVLNQCEILMIELNPEHLTYALLFLSFGLGALVFGICALFGKFFIGIVLALVVSFIGWKIPRPIVDYLVAKRISQYENQMVDALNLLANGLRAGLSLPQAVGMVVDEMPKPISEEYNLILAQNRIGVPLDECFKNLNKRLYTEDNEMFVTSISILRETGGNLAEVFDTITDIIRERIRLKQKIDTYIAQNKMQAMVVSSMPSLMLLFFAVSDPSSITPLFTTVIGFIALLLAAAFNIAGVYVIFKIINIKV